MVAWIKTYSFRKRMLKIKLAVIVATVSIFVCLAYSYFIEPNRLVVTNTEIRIKGWSNAFDGMRIAVIGDIHGGSNGVTEEKLRRIVSTTNAENPDLIVLLGDYVSQGGSGPISERPIKMSVETIAQNLAGLRASYGVLVVMGNHDYWFGAEKIKGAFSGDGYRVLQNEMFEIERGGKKLRILGLKDHMQQGAFTDFPEVVKQIAGPTDGDGDLILLEHSPDILPVVTGEYHASDDLKLIFAAHTHGGQIWLPVFGRPVVPSGFGQKYAYGHVFDRGLDMFVTSGIGESVLPFRFMVPPEIAVVTLRSADK